MRWAVLAVGLVAGVLLLGGGSGRGPSGPRLCLDVLDVGQGDALLVHLPGGERWLIDGGGDPSGRVDVGQRRLLPALRRQGVERLARVFATHGDLDHTGGLMAVLEELEVGELWLPRRSGISLGLRRLLSEAERRGVPVRSVEAGDRLVAPAPVDVVALHPLDGWVDALSLDAHENNGSIVLYLAMGGVGILLPGDVEGPTEDYLARRGLPRAAVLKVPHHGSRTSSTPALLAQVDPLVAVTGAGRENRFGFPHASVSARYLRRGVPFYWTGRHGALRTCTDGWTLDVEHDPLGTGWRALRSWDAEQLRAWRDARPPVAAPLPPPPPIATQAGGGLGSVQRRVRPHRPRRAVRRGAGRRARPAKDGATSAAGARAAAPKPTPEPTPPVLLDDRTWERRRKTRRRPKPPWKR